MREWHQRLLAQLRDIQSADRITADHLEEMAVPASELDLAAHRRPAVTTEALDSWRRFERGESLDENDLFQLETVILGNGLRPAFDIKNDSYATLPSVWRDLNDRRSAIEPLIRGIGRVDMTGHPKYTYVGTAFVCGDRRLITNRHVAQLFVEGVGPTAQLTFTSGITSSVDLRQEVESTASILLEVVAPVLVLDNWDAAVLEVRSLPSNVEPLPMAASAPSELENRMAAVIGYPSFDPTEDLVQQITIFRSVFDKKRLLPGRLKGTKPAQSFGQTVQALAHDCTTLGGNSGSAVIDVATATVVGIHFVGQRLVANYAVPTWALAAEQRVRDARVEFTS